MSMGYAMARHLLARTGFGGRPAEIEATARLPLAKAVDGLLATLRTTHATVAPTFVHEPPPSPEVRRSMRRELRKTYRRHGRQLQAWWLREMVHTDSPLTERLVVMWHNHFTSDLRKARWPVHLYRQNGTLRQHAGGNFKALLTAVLRDPAMLLYLDNQHNRVGRPNENMARELLELFTLGLGHYCERDIRETARALTGLRVDRRTGRTVLRRRLHDPHDKTIFGARAPFGAMDIPDLLLSQTRTAEHIAARVYREFVGRQPERPERRRLAVVFRDAGYGIRPLLRAVLLSPGFVHPASFGTSVRSPVELLVSTLRVLDLPVREWGAVAHACRRLGQALFQPPNVKGWPGGTAWIQAASLLGRNAVVRRALRGMETQYSDWSVVSRWIGTPGISLRDAGVRAERVLLPIGRVDRAPLATSTPIALFAQLMLDPAYQLK